MRTAMALGKKKHEPSGFGTARQNAVILGRNPAQRTTALSAAYLLAALLCPGAERRKLVEMALDFDLMAEEIRREARPRTDKE